MIDYSSHRSSVGLFYDRALSIKPGTCDFSRGINKQSMSIWMKFMLLFCITNMVAKALMLSNNVPKPKPKPYMDKEMIFCKYRFAEASVMISLHISKASLHEIHDRLYLRNPQEIKLLITLFLLIWYALKLLFPTTAFSLIILHLAKCYLNKLLRKLLCKNFKLLNKLMCLFSASVLFRFTHHFLISSISNVNETSQILCYDLSFLMKELLVIQGIEENPGPATYNIIKSVQGDFHQADDKFGDTGGNQCGINSLVAICFSTTKKISCWNNSHLNFVLENGDTIYKKGGYIGYITFQEMPEVLNLQDTEFTIVKLLQSERETTKELELIDNYEATIFWSETFLHNLNLSDGAILVMNDVMFVIKIEKKFVYLFDSHSRDNQGIPSNEGKSVLLKFKDVSEIKKYLKHIHLTLHNATKLWFQLQFFKCTSSQNDQDKLIAVFTSYQCKCRVSKHRANKSECKKLYDLKKSKEMYQNSKQEASSQYFAKLDNSKLKYQENKDSIKAKYQENKDGIKAKYQENKEEIKGSPQYKQQLKNQKRKHTEMLGSDEHENKKTRKRLKYHEKNKNKTCIEQFNENIRDGPFHVCVSCNRNLYRRSVRLFYENTYPNDIEKFYFAHICIGVDTEEYICRTCHSFLKKGEVPAQAVCNKLESFNVPEQFKDMRKLEKVLVARRLLFKKVLIMPRGEFRKIKGTICNVPLDSPDVVTNLSRGNDSTPIVIIKLKRKLEYKNNVYYESVRPSILLDFLSFLKEPGNNPLYSDIQLVHDNIPTELSNLGTSDDANDSDNEIDFHIERTEDKSIDENADDEKVDPLSEHRISNSETALIR